MSAVDETGMDEEQRRQQWIEYYLSQGDYVKARELQWEGDEPAPTERAPLTDKDLAATIIQARFRGFLRRKKYPTERNETARLRWVEYYVSTKQYEAAREYAWDSTEPSTETERAANVVQKIYRGFRQREDFKDIRDEEARQQWVAFYLKTGQLDKAAEFGHQLAATRAGPAAAKIRSASVAVAVLPPSRDYQKKLATTLAPKATTCLGQVAEAFMPRAQKVKRQHDLEALLMLQRCWRGWGARHRTRLMKREELLFQLVAKQEARHAKRIEYYIKMFLSSLEKNALYHSRARTLQAGFRGASARRVSRRLRGERKEEQQRRDRETAAAARAAADRAEAELRALRGDPARPAGNSVSFDAAQPLVLPRPIEIRPGMTVAQINTELERSARAAARDVAEKGRGRELATKTMAITRGFLKKKSPKAFVPALAAHRRFFYFQGERLIWRKTLDSNPAAPDAKFFALGQIASVLILEPIEKHEFALTLTAAGAPPKAYVFTAATQSEMVNWVQALKIILAVRSESAGSTK